MRRSALIVLVLCAALGAAGCSGDEPRPVATPTTSTPTPSPSAVDTSPEGGPRVGACFDLDYAQALAPTSDTASTGCRRTHTSQTFAQGRIDAVLGGHLLAVDSDRVQSEVAATCPRRLRSYLGGTTEDRRLSMLRSVWFTPTVEQSDAGADWFRCDVIAVGGPDSLADLDGSLRDVLAEPASREQWAMCGTDAPDAKDFTRVICSDDHSWRALSTVELPAGDYPGVASVRAAGQTPCEDRGREVAADKLDFQWGYEWPTEEQWDGGQTYGICWAPA